MTQSIKAILKEISETGLLVSKSRAAKMLKVSRNNFDNNFVETGLITPIYLPNSVHPRYSLREILEVPDRLIELQQLAEARQLSERVPQISPTEILENDYAHIFPPKRTARKK